MKQDPTVKQKTNRPSIKYCKHSNAIFQNKVGITLKMNRILKHIKFIFFWLGVRSESLT